MDLKDGSIADGIAASRRRAEKRPVVKQDPTVWSVPIGGPVEGIQSRENPGAGRRRSELSGGEAACPVWLRAPWRSRNLAQNSTELDGHPPIYAFRRLQLWIGPRTWVIPETDLLQRFRLAWRLGFGGL